MVFPRGEDFGRYGSRFAALAMVFATLAALAALAARPDDAGATIPGRQLKFQEEFDGSSLNYAKWVNHVPGKLVPGGAQEWLPEAVEVSGGQAHITARKTATGYTSGILTTFGTFACTYGRFEIRFRMPAGAGLEPQFRLLPVPSGESPSIDVLDALGNDPGTALFANRWGDAHADRDYAGSHKVADLSSGFHIATVEWDEEKILWSIDSVERFHSFDGVPHQPMYLAVYLAVGGDKAQEPDARTSFPAVFDIDYIRVFGRP
jgi:beta-glucanase (GH16 family)